MDIAREVSQAAVYEAKKYNCLSVPVFGLPNLQTENRRRVKSNSSDRKEDAPVSTVMINKKMFHVKLKKVLTLIKNSAGFSMWGRCLAWSMTEYSIAGLQFTYSSMISCIQSSSFPPIM